MGKFRYYITRYRRRFYPNSAECCKQNKTARWINPYHASSAPVVLFRFYSQMQLRLWKPHRLWRGRKMERLFYTNALGFGNFRLMLAFAFHFTANSTGHAKLGLWMHSAPKLPIIFAKCFFGLTLLITPFPFCLPLLTACGHSWFFISFSLIAYNLRFAAGLRISNFVCENFSCGTK